MYRLNRGLWIIVLFLLAMSGGLLWAKNPVLRIVAQNESIPQSKIAVLEKDMERHQDICSSWESQFEKPDRQLMPLGFYAMTEAIRDTELLEEMKRSGIVLAHRYASKQTIENAHLDLDAASSTGIGVLQNLPKSYLSESNHTFWTTHIKSLSNRNEVNVWYLPEEPKIKDFGYIENLASLIRENDPLNRPIAIYLENSNTDYLSAMASIVDVIVFGAYPTTTPHRPRSDIKRRIDKAYECGAGVVVAAVEALSYNGQWTMPEHIRFDAYLSMISGAKGLMWYCYYQFKDNDLLFREILAVAEEINGPAGIGEVFLKGAIVPEIECWQASGYLTAPPASAYENQSLKITKEYMAVQWTTRKINNNTYIFAVNMSESQNAEVKFKSFPGNSREAISLFDGYKKDIVSDSFQTSIGPLGVVAYRISK